MDVFKTHESYQDKEVLSELQRTWNETTPSRLLLSDFLDEQLYRTILHELKEAHFEEKKIADRYSYGLFIGENSLSDALSSNAFLTFLQNVTGSKYKQLKIEIRKYSWKDYTLLHDAESKKSKIEFFFFLPSVSEWDYFWGGTKIYQTEGGEGQPLVFIPTHNTLGLVDTSKNALGFTQYLNHYVGDEYVIVVEGYC